MASVTSHKVTVHQAKTNLSRLIAAALAGEEVIIARGDKPAVRLVPVEPVGRRQPDIFKGKMSVGPEFFEPLSDEELALWEDGPVF